MTAAPTKSAASLVEQYRQQLFDSFPYWLTETWRFQGLPAPARVQLDIAKWLQGGPKRRGILGFRGLSKTWITAAYICWRLYRNKEEKILLASASEGKARQTLMQVRKWLGFLPFCQHLAPQTGDRDNTEMFDVHGCKIDRIASVTAIGVTGALPGGRATLIIPDDVEQPENTITRQQRLRLVERVTEFECILSPGGDIVYLGTYHHLESLYDSLQRGAADRQFTPYRFRTWPIQYPERSETTSTLSPMLHYDLRDGRAKPGDPVWPERFGLDYIHSLVMGKTKFLQQFMLFQDANKTTFPLKVADLIVHPINTIMAPVTIQWGKHNSKGSTAIEDIPSPGFGDDQFYAPCMVADQWVKYVGCKGFLDPASSGEDEMAWCIGGQLHGYIYAKHLAAVKGGPTEKNLSTIIQSIKDQHCSELYVEKNFGGEGLIRLLEMEISKAAIPPDPKNDEYPNGWSCAVIPISSTGQKEVRIINTLEPVMNHHRLVISPEIAKDQELMSQMVNLQAERDCLDHDDRIEALAGMVAQFADAIGQNPAQQAERLAKADQDKRLEAFYRQFGIKPPAKTWSGL